MRSCSSGARKRTQGLVGINLGQYPQMVMRDSHWVWFPSCGDGGHSYSLGCLLGSALSIRWDPPRP